MESLDDRQWKQPAVNVPAARKRRFRPLYLLAAGPLIIGLLVVLRVFFPLYFIPSGAMLPTLEQGDRVSVDKLISPLRDVERGHLIVFQRPGSEDPTGIPNLIKRVIGLPGETVSLNNGEVRINGDSLVEPYLAEGDTTRPLRNDAIPGCGHDSPITCTVPEGYVFVMGDNRSGSRDSREFGPIPIDSIVGRASVRVWPLSDYGRL